MTEWCVEVEVCLVLVGRGERCWLWCRVCERQEWDGWGRENDGGRVREEGGCGGYERRSGKDSESQWILERERFGDRYLSINVFCGFCVWLFLLKLGL